jgi:hypothetical protein
LAAEIPAHPAGITACLEAKYFPLHVLCVGSCGKCPERRPGLKSQLIENSSEKKFYTNSPVLVSIL